MFYATNTQLKHFTIQCDNIYGIKLDLNIQEKPIIKYVKYLGNFV
jgi:hypothetical protein